MERRAEIRRGGGVQLRRPRDLRVAERDNEGRRRRGAVALPLEPDVVPGRHAGVQV